MSGVRYPLRAHAGPGPGLFEESLLLVVKHKAVDHSIPKLRSSDVAAEKGMETSTTYLLHHVVTVPSRQVIQPITVTIGLGPGPGPLLK